MALHSPNISFDTHAYLCHERLRSELTDRCCISDRAEEQVFLFIETKYLTNWTYAADVAKGPGADWTRSLTPIRSPMSQRPASVTLC